MTTIEEAVSTFNLDNIANGLSSKTISWYHDILKIMMQNLGQNTTLGDVSKNDMRLYIVTLRESGLARETVRSYITGMKRFWHFASQEFQCLDPMITIKRPAKKTPAPKGVHPRDALRMLQATNPDDQGKRDLAILCLAYDTGARRGGMVNLRLDDIDLVNNRAIVTEKYSKQRWIYWTHFTSQIIHRWMSVRPNTCDSLFVSMRENRPHTPLTGSGMYQVFKRLAIKANVKGFSNPHAFRHGFAREYILNGGDVVTLARLLGHEDVNLTAAYYAVFSSDELADMQAKHSPLMKILKTL